MVRGPRSRSTVSTRNTVPSSACHSSCRESTTGGCPHCRRTSRLLIPSEIRAHPVSSACAAKEKKQARQIASFMRVPFREERGSLTFILVAGPLLAEPAIIGIYVEARIERRQIGVAFHGGDTVRRWDCRGEIDGSQRSTRNERCSRDHGDAGHPRRRP